MASFNKVILVGHLTRDPELRYTPKGTAIAKLGVAVNRVWTTDTGEKREEATFVDVNAFDRQAEVIGQYFKKGRPILVEGRLHLNTWEDKQTNQKRSKLEVVLEGFQFLDSGRQGEGAASAPARPVAASSSPNSSAAPATAPEPEVPPHEEDDVPF